VGIIIIIFYFSSPFLFVFGDNRVTYHTRADANLGDDIDALW